MEKEKKIIPIIFSIEQYDWLKEQSARRLQSISAILREFVNKEKDDEKASNRK